MQSFKYEEDLSGIKGSVASIYANLAYNIDSTAYSIFPGVVSLNTAATVGRTAITAVMDLSKWAQAILYIDSSAAVARTAATGLTVSLACRPESAIAWTLFNTYSGVDESGVTVYRIQGSGIADTSGMNRFGDVRLIIDNITDSGSATVQAWLFARTTI